MTNLTAAGLIQADLRHTGFGLIKWKGIGIPFDYTHTSDGKRWVCLKGEVHVPNTRKGIEYGLTTLRQRSELPANR